MKDRYAYIAIFHYADDGISISFPDLPGCLPCAGTTEDAIKNAKEAMGLHLWSMETDKDDIPDPTPVTSIKLTEGEIPMLVEIFMPPIREKINTRFVKKTLSLPGWLAARGDESNVNYSKLFQNALIDYLGIEIVQR